MCYNILIKFTKIHTFIVPTTYPLMKISISHVWLYKSPLDSTKQIGLKLIKSFCLSVLFIPFIIVNNLEK